MPTSLLLRADEATNEKATVGLCAGFRAPALMSESRTDAAGVRKAPRHEIAAIGQNRLSLKGFGRF